MAAPTLASSVIFVRDSGGTINIRVTDTTDWVGSGIALTDVKISVAITGPDGLVFHNADLLFPDIDPSVSLVFETPCPLDMTGKPQTGNYYVQTLARVVGGVYPGDYTSANVLYELCSDYPVLCLSHEINCLYVFATLTDTTPWATNGWVVDSRNITLYWPQGTPGGPTQTTTAASLTTGTSPMYTGTYAGLLEITATKGNLTSSFQYRMEFEMNCPAYNLCNLLCCLSTWVTKAKSLNDGSAIEAKAVVAKLTSLMTIINAASSCGNQALLDIATDDFYKIGSCTSDCGCGCSDGEGPSLIVPLHPGSGGGGGVTFTIEEGTGISVTYNSFTDVYTIALNSATIALLSAIYNTEVTSNDGSLTVSTATTPGIPDTTTFDLSVPLALRAQDSIEFRVRADVVSQTCTIVGTPVVKGSFFKGTGLSITQVGPVYNITGFLTTAVNSDFNIITTIEDFLKDPLYSADASKIFVESFSAGPGYNFPTSQTFGLAFKPTDIGTFGIGQIGTMQALPYWKYKLLSWTTFVRITKA